MNVKEQIAVLQAAIDELSKHPAETSICGHVAYPDGGYSGDLSGEIYRLEIESPPDDEELEEMTAEEAELYNGIIVGVYYK